MKRNFVLRGISFVLAVWLCILLLPIGGVTVKAAYENTHTNTGDQASDIVAVAQTQIGYQEGSNNANKYSAAFNHNNVEWCAYFVSWCAKEAGISDSIIHRQGVASPFSGYFNIPNTHTSTGYFPKPGDLVFYGPNDNGDHYHVGIVETANKSTGYITTIEGNTNSGGSSTGNCVYRHTRHYQYANICCYGTPNYIGGDPHTCNKAEYVFYEAAHPHYKCYKCSICGEIWRNTAEPTILSSCTTCTPQHAETPTIRWWLSDSEYGDTVDTYKAGNRYYFCYRMFDSVTGKNWDEVETANYTIKLTFYNPDGSVKHTNQSVFDYDQSWISSFFAEPGTYKVGIVAEGDYVLSETRSFIVEEDPIRIYSTQNDVSLKLGETEKETLYIGVDGYYNGTWKLTLERDNANVSCSWGEWTDEGLAPLTFTANNRGSANVKVFVRDKTTDAILDSMTITVHVDAKTYTVGYNANGGNGAPGSQTKFHNSALALSSSKPTRSGYTFLGWSTSSSATVASYQPGDSFVGNANTTLYAVWKKGCAADAHNYSYLATKAPTTSATGTLTGTCSLCAGTTTITLPKLTSTDYYFKEFETVTCTENGIDRYLWKVTDYGSFYFDVIIPASGHNYKHIVTLPTCTAQGYTTHHCGCQHRYVDSYVPALGHSFTQYVSDNNATCTTDGTKTAKCDRCTETDTQTDTDSKLGHSFANYVSNSNATCTADGTETAKCNRCTVTDTRTDVDSKLGHSFTNYVSNSNATCTADGTETAKCNRCTVTDTRTDVDSKLGHSFTNYVSNSNATCTADGTETAKCNRCTKTDTRTDVDSKLGHSFTNYVSNSDATCLEDGTETAKCDRCEVTDTRTDIDSKLGHSFTNYQSNNDATYDADGTKTAKCDRCDATHTVTDPGTKLQQTNGWVSEGGKWYYYKDDTKLTGWVLDGKVWYYMSAQGVMQTGWLKEGNTWYYLKSSGAMATGWANVGSVYYYFNTSGVMQTGWLKQGNTWYYLKSSGAMATGWAQISGKWYYFASSGAMVTGWQKIGTTWYYFQSGGAMQTGWLKLGNTWYYFNASGAMATGSVKIGAKTYRFNASGACLNP